MADLWIGHFCITLMRKSSRLLAPGISFVYPYQNVQNILTLLTPNTFAYYNAYTIHGE